jgi:hypothetical protein
MSLNWYRIGTARTTMLHSQNNHSCKFLFSFEKMVDANGGDTNLLFVTLSQWNTILQDTSIVNLDDYKATIAKAKKPPKAEKAHAKSTPMKAPKRIGGAHGRVK